MKQDLFPWLIRKKISTEHWTAPETPLKPCNSLFLDPLHQPVVVFSGQHIIALLVCLITGAWYIFSAKNAEGEDKEWMTRLLALLLILAYPLSVVLRTALVPGLRWQETLPLHMCSIMTFVAGAALLYECPFLRALTYFIGIPVCIQALITPDLAYSFPHPVFFEFLASHLLIVIAALYLPIVLEWRPRKFDFIRAFLFGAGYLAIALALNPLLGTNYGFASKAPEGGSLLDILGPWPWYLLSLLPVGFAGLWLISLPFRFFPKQDSTPSS